MYEKLNITENHLQVLSLFTCGFNRDYYIREIQRLLKISPRTVQLALEDLENEGVLESKMRGKIKSYTLKVSAVSTRFLVLVEQYKAIIFFKNSLLVKEIVDKIYPFIDGIGIIFGSYAKGNSTQDSDLDVFVAGTYDVDQVKRVEKNLGLTINIKCYPLDLFTKNLSEDILIKEILKNHLVIKNVELFLQRVLSNG